MNIRNLICVFLLINSASSYSESDGINAEIPYAVFYNIATAKFSEAELKSKSFSFIFSSNRSDVKAQNIKVYIKTKGGNIPLLLNSEGECIFPINSELLKENPYVVSNQPKGTMETKFSINYKFNGSPENIVLDVVDNLNLRYKDIFKARQINQEVLNSFSDGLKEYLDNLNITTEWIEFRPAKFVTSPAVIHSSNGDINLNPDDDGIIRIKFEPALFVENPIVSFPDYGKIIFRSNNAKSITK